MLKRIEVKEIINISSKLVNLSHLQLELKYEIIDLNKINLNLGKFMWFHEIKEITKILALNSYFNFISLFLAILLNLEDLVNLSFFIHILVRSHQI